MSAMTKYLEMHPSENISLKDEVFFDSFFRRNYQTLCYFAFSFLKNKDLSEDVVQNIFIKTLNESELYASEDHLKFFLYKAIRNECINELKKNEVHSKILDKIGALFIDDETDMLGSIVRAEIYQEIISAINSLPEKCGIIFKLAYIEHMDNNEISEKLSISVNTVKVQKNNAKKQLREYLKHLYPIAVFIFHL
ncbi:RNA polymerase sigma-70 factor [Dysgonomonas sp. Marseille-P4677]|uniref:RNA polymerase sigma factor n=1 Tax=Dysgonomonas sp. Marseille-P4677 TaxID=2364790 RepID=UPI001914A36E|nr:RNA polymerase sigma-70 factor [Dysgonomonas sp. Marseille-P4677]MBK5720357.1 RNA polymerase sigma-70 factor [Dysgonomonas sp. Marseille-P4677]